MSNNDAPKNPENGVEAAQAVQDCLDKVSDEEDRDMIQQALDDVIAACACGVQQREAAAARMDVIRTLTPFQHHPRIARLLAQMARKQLSMCEYQCASPQRPAHPPHPHNVSQQLRPLPQTQPPPPQPLVQPSVHHQQAQHQPRTQTPPQPIRHMGRDLSPDLLVEEQQHEGDAKAEDFEEMFEEEEGDSEGTLDEEEDEEEEEYEEEEEEQEEDDDDEDIPELRNTV